MNTPLVLLINPRICSQRSMRLPLSLLALGAVLEGKTPYRIIDGNVDPDPAQTALDALATAENAVVGITVMPGPQVAPAIQIASAIRAAYPHVPIVWGGYFPTLYTEAAINAPYVDYVVRGQGEETLLELLERLPDAGPPTLFASACDPTALIGIRGLTWKDAYGIHHNPERHFHSPDDFPPFPYERAGDVRRYLRPSFMGTRTGVHQAAIGCRYHCTFCGVVSMFNGKTILPKPNRLYEALKTLRDDYGANAMQFYDNNFFDREETSVPMLEVLAEMGMPWWCYARADTLAKFSAQTWELIRRSRLRMAYIGAEAASDSVLAGMKKGTRVEHTFAVARRCREYGVIPEFSFVLGGPDDPEGEIEKTFGFIKQIKRVHPECEVILYFYSPTPQRDPAAVRADTTGARLPVLKTYGADGPPLPTTPEEWTQPQWVTYVCHQDAPWLSPRMRQRVQDFARVLACRFPTAQDYHTPAWGKAMLRALSRWRYATGRYDHPRELDFARRLIPLREPQKESL
ncbi:MAG TPA: cobalamin-dependent protein [Chthonomonadaceae bacterium]|nr:cobalamin-dependent protein [Chthonomonadaceae bacterium]